MIPLKDVLVLSLEQAVAAPFATRHLADLGARVIKVERPHDGDFARHYDRSVRGQSSYFVWLNRGKESIELDIKDPVDRAVLDRMLDRADVFVQNLAPGAAARLRLDAEELRSRLPELIYCSISGYGAPGPYATKKAYDLLIQCETGLLEATGTPDSAVKVGISIADIATGMYAYAGILAALYERRATGNGATIDVAMIDALGEWMMQPSYYVAYSGKQPERSGASHAYIAPYGPYHAADGVVFLAIQSDKEWIALCRDILSAPEVASDHRFRHNPERVAHRAELTALLERHFAAYVVQELLTALDAAGIANAKVRTPAEFMRHPQLAARERWRQIDTPNGPITALQMPVRFNDDIQPMGDIPALGQHNEALRTEFAPHADRP